MSVEPSLKANKENQKLDVLEDKTVLAKVSQNNHLQTNLERFNPLDYKTALQTPQRLTDVSSWHKHIPFAFTLIEILQPQLLVELGTHKGDSYCAFCQVISTLGLTTTAYAIDSWEGDEHAGKYDDNIYQELKNYHDPRYGGFSTLLKSLFDDALERFADSSIDLLHIDGLHTYEAVKHDFELWLPKLSRRGIILFHDINVHENDFGVWRLWAELQQRYPSLEFKHGHGLGVIAVGDQIPPPLALLFNNKEQAKIAANYYAHLGELVTLTQQFKASEAYNKELGTVIRQRDQYVIDQNQQRENLEAYVSKLEQEVETSKNALQEADKYRQRIETQLAQFQQTQQEANSYRQHIETQLAQFQQTQQEANNYRQQLETELQEANNYRQQLETELQRVIQEKQTQQQLFEQEQQKVENYRQHIENELQEANNYRQQLEAESQKAAQERVRLETELKTITQQYAVFETKQKEFEEGLRRSAAQEREVAQQYQQSLKTTLFNFRHENQELANQLNLLNQQKQQLEASLDDWRSKFTHTQLESQHLKELLVQRAQIISQLDSDNAAVASDNARLWEQLANIQKEYTSLQQHLIKVEAVLNALQSKQVVRFAQRLSPRVEKPVRLVKAALQNSIDGAIDQPAAETAVKDNFTVKGWAYSSAARIQEITVLLDGKRVGIARYGEERSDVITLRPWQLVINCGYTAECTIDYKTINTGQAKLIVRVADYSGNLRDFVQPVTVEPTALTAITNQNALVVATTTNTINSPIDGFIDDMNPGSLVRDTLTVRGWAYSKDAAIKQVQVWLGNYWLGKANYGLERFDIIEARPSYSTLNCGYGGNFELDYTTINPGPETLRIEVEDYAGNKAEFTMPVVIEPSAKTPETSLSHQLIKEPPKPSEISFEGSIDSPTPYSTITNKLMLHGWFYPIKARIKQIEVFLDDYLLGTATYGAERVDVIEARPWQLLLNCGYHGTFEPDYKVVGFGEKLLRVRAEDYLGNQQELSLPVLVEPNFRFVDLITFNHTDDTKPVIKGAIDMPVLHSLIDKHLTVAGWAYSLAAPIKEVEVILQDRLLGKIEYGLERPDVLELEPEEAIRNCGFRGSFELDQQVFGIGGQTITVHIEDADGNRHSLTRIITVLPVATVNKNSAGTTAEYKQMLSGLYKNALKSFLISGSKLTFQKPKKPVLSVILVLYNRAELTFQCLRSLAETGFDGLEIVIVDNASSDDTHQLLDCLEGVKMIRNKENLHFLLASNQASKEAKGDYLLFLNNDAQVLPGTITAALKTIKNTPDVGAVGGKIIFLDGSLQEAGSIVWRDGSCVGYGRDDSPFAPMYMFKREVDYCSGAFLMTPRQLFLEVGGFDEAYKPAYYEEVDYCLRLRKKGKKIIYDPDAAILHYEFASSTSSEAAIQLQIERRAILVQKHYDWLQKHHLNYDAGTLLARHADKKRPRVLFIDDRIPHNFFGSGAPRAREMLMSMLELNCFVTFYPRTGFGEIIAKEDWHTVYEDIPKEVEIIANYGIERLGEFLDQRRGYYQAIVISRPYNMQILEAIATANPDWFKDTKIIYDAEAVFSVREVLRRKLLGEEVAEEEVEKLITDEIKLAKKADTILCVSKNERTIFSEHGYKDVHILSHTAPVVADNNPFEKRADFLFVGAVYQDDSPNGDAVIWFSEEVLPKIITQLDPAPNFRLVGINKSTRINSFPNEKIKVMGRVDDLNPVFKKARIFVAPTRYAAGIPLKVLEAAAYGVPVVATSLIATQLDWQDGRELLVADDPEIFAAKCVQLYQDRQLWQHLRDNALKRMSTEYSKAAFTDKIRKIIGVKA